MLGRIVGWKGSPFTMPGILYIGGYVVNLKKEFYDGEKCRHF